MSVQSRSSDLILCVEHRMEVKSGTKEGAEGSVMNVDGEDNDLPPVTQVDDMDVVRLPLILPGAFLTALFLSSGQAS